MLALPIFTPSHPGTIVGTRELNFCVRNGNRWTLTVINTNYVFPVKEENNQRPSLALFYLNSRCIVLHHAGIVKCLRW